MLRLSFVLDLFSAIDLFTFCTICTICSQTVKQPAVEEKAKALLYGASGCCYTSVTVS
jgi:hypothetical protein